MPEQVECAALLFDLDGTLIDSGDAVLAAWTRFARDIGRDPAEILAKCHGVRTVEVIDRLDLGLPARETADEVESYIVDAGSTPIAGAVDLLRSVPEQRWAVVTSSLPATAASRFSQTDLPAPQFIVSADDVPEGKPDPGGYLLAAERLGVAPADCIVVEDAVAGIGAARAAGMRSIAVATTSPPDQLTGATWIVGDLRAVRCRLADTGQLELMIDVL